MDFTSAFLADPRGAVRSYTRQGSSQHQPVNEAISRDGEMQ